MLVLVPALVLLIVLCPMLVLAPVLMLVLEVSGCTGGAKNGVADMSDGKNTKHCMACAIQKGTQVLISLWDSLIFGRVPGTKGHSSTDLAMGFANVRAGTWYRAQVHGAEGAGGAQRPAEERG